MLADRQHGLLTADQLHQAGYSSSAIADACAKRWLIRVDRGVYRVAGATRSWRASAQAALLSIGGDALLSHYSAGALWGLLSPAELDGQLHVTTSSRLVRRRGIVDYRRILLPAERVERHGIVATSVERTILDIAEAEPVNRIGRLIDDALRARLTSIRGVAAMVELHRRRGEPRLGGIREALAERGAGYDPGANPWEQRMDRMWEEMGLPPAIRQYTIVLPCGRRVRPDRAIPELKLAVEWNGFAWHGLRSDFESDIERRNQLIRAGWTVLEFHSRQSADDICQTVLGVYKELTAKRARLAS